MIDHTLLIYSLILGDFPGGPVIKNLPSNEGGSGSIPACSWACQPQLETILGVKRSPLPQQGAQVTVEDPTSPI